MKQEKITSKDNLSIRKLRKLLNDKEFRHEQSEYVIEGRLALGDLKKVKDLFVCEGVEIPDIGYDRIFLVEKKVFESVSATKNSQGLLGVAELIVFDSSKIDSSSRYVFLDRLQDPGNMGTIIRTSAAFGIKGIVFLSGTVDPFSPKVVRASAGSLEKIEIIKINEYSQLKPFAVIAADISGESLNSFKWPESFILAIGNEGGGLSDGLLPFAKKRISIPMPGNVESLNAAVSAGILLYCASIR